MKFIISKDGTIIINSAFVRTMYIEEDNASYEDNHTVIRVIAELDKNSSNSQHDYPNFVVNLATFDSSNLQADYKAAHAYLAKLFSDLNGGTK